MIALGVGFSSRCSADELAELAMAVLEQAPAGREAAPGGRIATLARKRQSGLLEPVAERLGLTPCYLTESELAAVEAAVGSSPRTAETVGVGSVAEAAALAAAGPGGRLVVERVTSPLATCAAAEGGLGEG